MAATRGYVFAKKFPEKLKIIPLSPRQQVEAMKQEIRNKIALLRDRLNSLECDLIAEVDRLGALQENERKELKEKIDSLKTVKTSLLETKCSEEAKLSLAVAIKDFDNKINKFSQELLQYEKIESTWHTSYWDVNVPGLNVFGSYNSDNLHKLCTLASVKIIGCVYQSKQNPKWQITEGPGPSQLRSPLSLAIQYSTRDVYVSDKDGMRIQVFSPQGEHKILLDMLDNGPLQVISIDSHYLFAYSTKGDVILQLLVNSMNTCSTKYFCKMSLKKSTMSNDGNCYSIRFNRENKLTKLCEPGVGEYQKLHTQSLTPNIQNITLREHKSTSLKITPVDIAYYHKSIFILSSKGGDLIHEFDLDCNFVRSFFPCPTMSRPLAMCIDREGNIIVAGDSVKPVETFSALKTTSATRPPLVLVPNSYPVPNLYADRNVETKPTNQSATTKLFVLSQKGDLIIHEMDIPCENCIGIAVSSNFDIFLLNKDDNSVLSSL